jgi:hypothetical protein
MDNRWIIAANFEATTLSDEGNCVVVAKENRIASFGGFRRPTRREKAAGYSNIALAPRFSEVTVVSQPF